MAKRRRRKRKQKNDPVITMLTGLCLLSGIGGYLLSNSLMVAAIFFFVTVFVIAFIQFKIQAKRKERIKRSGIADIDKMDGRQFEHYLGILFQAHGYRTEVTPSAGDYGADLILSKDGKRIAVQAKRYSSNIGVAAVQEVQAAIGYYKVTEGWVVTNRGYTKQAKELAASNSVRLIDREELIELILKINPGAAAAPAPKEVIAELGYEPKKCNKCGNPLVVRKGEKGDFWGCSAFPKCRNAVDITK